MRREGKKYLYDIYLAAALVADFTRGKTHADYERDAMLRAAVERKLEIIGEAMNRLAAIDSTAAARISEYRRTIAFRNILSDIALMPQYDMGSLPGGPARRRSHPSSLIAEPAYTRLSRLSAQ